MNEITGVKSIGKPVEAMVRENPDAPGTVTLPWTDYVRLVQAHAALKRWVDAAMAGTQEYDHGPASPDVEMMSAEIAACEVMYPHLGDNRARN
jgi:hypothetical protein